MRLTIVALPIHDVERAKAFYRWWGSAQRWTTPLACRWSSLRLDHANGEPCRVDCSGVRLPPCVPRMSPKALHPGRVECLRDPSLLSALSFRANRQAREHEIDRAEFVEHLPHNVRA